MIRVPPSSPLSRVYANHFNHAADYNSAFPAGGTVAASFDRALWYQRGYEMGEEHRDKGVDVQLGPVVGPLGRVPAAGRNWEGKSAFSFGFRFCLT